MCGHETPGAVQPVSWRQCLLMALIPSMLLANRAHSRHTRRCQHMSQYAPFHLSSPVLSCDETSAPHPHAQPWNEANCWR